MSGVCGPAKRSRSSTCTTPMRSTTATVAWKPRLRQFFERRLRRLERRFGVSTLTVKVRVVPHGRANAKPSSQ